MKRIFCYEDARRIFLSLLSTFLILMMLMPVALCSNGDIIPSGLKKNYRYNTEDKSIIPVKQRLADLGYLPVDKASNAWINNTVKKAVIEFQEKNGMEADGKLDSAFFVALFSDSAIAKADNRETGETREKAEEPDTSKSIIGHAVEARKYKEKNDNGMFFYIGIALLFCVCVMIGIMAHIRKKKREAEEARIAAEKQFVVQNSEKYKALCELNKRYMQFYDAPGVYTLTQSFKSKQSLERADINDVFLVLANNDDRLHEIYRKLGINRMRYTSYKQELSKINNMSNDYVNSLEFDRYRFLQIENELCTPIEEPMTDISISVELRYISPQGNKSYAKSGIAHYSNLQYAYHEAQKRQAIRAQAELERAKMNASLRYKVLQRDGFRCKICGASERDGVKLHVDHIVPVSKGGKTEMNNLRTLCDRCNLGKGAFYDENELV